MSRLRLTFSLLAVVVAVFAAAFTTPKLEKSGEAIEYYYRFDGAVGEENQMSKWTQIPSYASATCVTGAVRGCKITNTTNSSGHPTSVPLSGGLPVVQNPTQPVVQNKNN